MRASVMSSHKPSKLEHSAHKKSTNQHTEVTHRSKEDEMLIESLGLSPAELKTFQQLNISTQTKIIDLLRQRNLLNDFVKNHLQEDIRQYFGIWLQFFLPSASENNLKYALQKVDEIEVLINDHVDGTATLFDTDTTKRNRLSMLLVSAESYQQQLTEEIQQLEHRAQAEHADELKKKNTDLLMIIKELHTQIDKSEFYLHNKAILRITDSEFKSFLNKVKSIGIAGFNPKSPRNQMGLFKITISAIYERLIPSSTPEKDSDASENNEDTETKPRSHKPHRSK